MSRPRPVLSLLLCLALGAGSAAPQAYAAVGKSVTSKPGAPAPVPQLKAPAIAAPIPGLPQNAVPAAKTAAAPVAAAPQAQARPQAGPASTTLDRLAVPLPEFQAQGDLSRDAAGQDFLKRTAAGDREEAAGAVDASMTAVAAGSTGRATLGPSKRRTPGPDEVDDGTDDRRRSPDDPLNSDDLGNPPRDPGRDDGPDGTGGGGPMIKVPKVQRGFSTGTQLLLVGAGALAFAAFGALGFSALAAGSSIVAAVNAVPLVKDLFLNGAHLSAAVPLMASMAIAPLVGTGPPAATPPQPAQTAKPVELVVKLNAGVQPLSADMHLSFADPRTRKGFALYRQMADRMYAQLQAAGINRGELDSKGVAPIATYQRINTTTLVVSDAAKAAEVRAWLESQGHTVYQDVRRSIVRPMPRPADQSILRNSVTMDQSLEITRATGVQALARQMFGDPDAGLVTRAALWLTGAAIPAIKHAVIDTGIDGSHPWLKGILEKNVTAKAPGDDDGHGSWTQGTVTLFAPWLRKSATHYKAFVGGNASLDDILKALTMAANDGNLVISNSWGDDEGDPYSPDSELVRKLAMEGHIMVFAAGNAGPGKNTVGNPGGVVYKDPKTGALRVLSIAAAKRDKTIDYFSSRGPRPRKVKNDPNYPHVPTGPAAIGSNVEGPYPQGFGIDRVDPKYGPVKAEWGTSMATPEVAGAIVLLCLMFGVTTRGEKLDAVVNAVMATLEKTGEDPDAGGEGFLNVQAAYDALKATMKPVVPNIAARLALNLVAPPADGMPRAVALERKSIVSALAGYDRRRTDFVSSRRTYNDDVDPLLDEQEAILRRRLEDIDAQYGPEAKGR